MRIRPDKSSKLAAKGWRRNWLQWCAKAGRQVAFTLLEMLVVISIMGIIVALAAPSFKNLAGGNVVNAANRQLMDDLNQARLRAINGRTTVYVLFFPRASQVIDGGGTPITQPPPPLNGLYTLFGGLNATNAPIHPQANSLLGGQYTAYAMYSKRSLGDQLGRDSSQYLSEWRYLPDGAFLDTNSFAHTNIFFNIPYQGLANPYVELFPIPAVSNGTNSVDAYVPFIAYDSSGRLVGRKQDVHIPMSRGSVSAPRANASTGGNSSRAFLPANADAREQPPNVVTNGSVVQGVTYFLALNPNRPIAVPAGSINYNGNNIEVGETFRGVQNTPNWTVNGNAATVQVKVFEGVTINWLTGRARVVRPELQ